MKITVFGASGRVGRLVVDEALARGHQVTAFVHQTALPERQNLSVIKGDVYDAESVARAVGGADAIISALGSWGTPRKDVTASAIAHILPAMQTNSIKRIVGLTGHGADAPGDSFEFLHSLSRLILLLLAPKILHDGEKQIKLLSQSDAKWTVIRAPLMNHFGQVDRFTLNLKRPLPLATINRQSVADSLLDLVEAPAFIKQAPFIVRS